MRRTSLVLAFVLSGLFLGPGSIKAQSVPGSPTTVTVVATAVTLQVTWSAPTELGGSAVTAYHVRHIESAADETDDANWTRAEDAWETGGGDLAYTIEGLLDSTSYKVAVRAVNDQGPSLWTDPLTSSTPDHGRYFSQATPLPVGGSLRGQIDTGDEGDLFEVTLPAAGMYWVFTTGELDTQGTLWDVYGLGTQTDGHTPRDMRQFSILRGYYEGGTNHILVEAEVEGATGTYTIHLRSVADPGDTKLAAQEVTLGQATGAILRVPGEVDYFRFTLTETTDVAIESAGWVHTRAQLLREDETEIAAAQGGYVTRPRHEDSNFQGFMMRRTLDAGSYLLKVSSVPEVVFGFLDPVSPTGVYFLLIEEPADPGSSRATATPLALRHTVAGRISSASDEDYYSLTVDKETYVTITAVPYGTPFPLVPTFFDADGTDLDAYVIRREEYGYEGRREAFAIVTQVDAGTYYVRVKAPDGGTGGPYVLSAWDTDYGQDPVKRCTDIATLQSDPLYGCQWHLKNTRQLGIGASEDINVEGVWETNKGEGINVVVVDTMVQPNHEDLVGTPDDPLDPDDDELGRFDTARSHDYYDRGLETFEPHGTNVAGLIAARANDIGVRGVAPEATIYSFNLLAQDPTDAQRADVFTRHMDVTAISNHSYGAVNGGTPSAVPGVWRMALERAVTDGYDGKGVFITWAAGNDGDYGGWASLDERTTSYAVTAVCAIDILDQRPAWSTRGPNLWICAPGHDLTSTRTANRYTRRFAGTSGATPIVAGVAALVRAADPDLTWRDVKLILANSARKNHPSHTRLPGALKYGSTSERYSFSYDYGFGAVDAGAAVALAKNWTDLPSLRKLEVSSGPLNIAIPDATHGPNFSNIVGKEISTSLKADSNFIEFIEFIELEVSITHTQARSLFIQLDSPSTTTSEITVPYFGGGGRSFLDILFGTNWPARLADMVNPFTFGTARHLGEGAAGEWTLRIRDDDAVLAGTLHSWKLTFYGHGYRPGFPTLRTRDNRERIRINFDPPEDTGATPITSYDLRYIRANVPDKSDESLWTVVTGFPDPNNVGHNYLRGLLPGRRYDLQIRAVNATGAGPWSAASRAGQLPEPPRAPAIGGIVPRDRGLGVTWSAPEENGGTFINSYDLRANAGNWREFRNVWRSGDGDLTARISGLTNNVSHDVQVRARNGIGEGPWSTAVVTGTPAVQNQAPSFPPAETGARAIPEGPLVGRNVGAPVSAVDPDTGSLTYFLSSGDEFFRIDSNTGQLLTRKALDHEAVPSHVLTVDVSDSKNSSDDSDAVVDDFIEVTVTVEDVNEAPEVMGETSVARDENSDLPIDVYAATDPEGGATSWVELMGADGGHFELDESGELSFAAPPDFEARADSGRDNVYNVIVRASDDGTPPLIGELAVTVTVTPVDEAPVIDGEASVVDYPENSLERVGDYTKADPEGRATTWLSLMGADALLFTIDEFGELTFAEPPDFEARTNNVYNVIVRASDDGTPPLIGSLAVTVTVTPVDERPVVSGPASIADYPENSLERVGRYTKADPEGRATSWLSLMGADALLFTIDEFGELSFAEPPDFEARADSGTDNVYNVIVRASDDGTPPLIGSLAVTVTVTPVDEPPVITGDRAPSIEEGGTLLVGTYRATDPEDATIAWQPLVGSDADKFEFTPSNGRLAFKAAPDFEDADRGGDNEYGVTLGVSAGGDTTPFDVEVTVTNKEEPGTLALPTTQPQADADYTATLSDPDGVQSTTWTWERSTSRSGPWADVTGAFDRTTTSVYAPAAGDVGYYLRATAAYTDGHGPNKSAVAVSTNSVLAAPVVNNPPAFTETNPTRSIAENAQADALVGGRVTATDPDQGNTVRYEFALPVPTLFTIDGGSGQIRVKTAETLDYETAPSHIVTVKALDSSNASDTVQVTIEVTDVNERPVVRRRSGTGPFSIVENSGTDVGRFVATDPEGRVVTWSLATSGDHGRFEIEANGALSFKEAPDFESDDLGLDKAYTVTVQATEQDGGDPLTGRLAVTVAVTNVNEPPTISGPVVVDFTENGDGSVAMYSATDPDVDATQAWSLAGADGGDFAITDGVLTFIDPPDYDMPTDRSLPNNEYLVTVQVYDGANRVTRPVTVRVLDVNEAPTVSGNLTPSVEENSTAVATYTATDPEGVTVTWSLQGGGGVFMITSAGALAFTTAPNYEVESSYTVTVRASDGVNTTNHFVTVTVTDVNEPEVLTLSDPSPLIGLGFTAAFKGTGDNVDNVQPPTWAWARSAMGSSSGWMPITDATNATYEPTGDDRERYLRVTASYDDGHGTKTLSKVSDFTTKPNSGTNTAPAFPIPLFGGGVTGLSVHENAGVRTVVGVAPEATDMQGGGLRYFLAVDGFTIGPPFGIDAVSRQIRVAPGARLNHEGQDTYGVTVTVKDEYNATATATFDITIEDVNEPPVAVADPSVTTEEDTPVTFDVLGNDTDPDDGDTLMLSITSQPSRGRVVADTTTQLVTYTPAENDHGTYTFMYTASDGTLSSLPALVTVTVNPVNDAPAFAAAPAERTVSENAQPGANVGVPVTATDVDGDLLGYRIQGAPDFEIDEQTGQITVATGAALNAALSPYIVTVTARDPDGDEATVEVTITVTAGPVIPPVIIITGGGGGGGGGPSPSEVDFEWTVQHDIAELDGGNDRATGVWSDGTTLWVADNADGAGDALYAYDRETGERVEEREFALHETNRAPRGFWSDRSVVWVSDSGQERLFAYDLATGQRVEEREFALAERNADARGIWSDEKTMWVLDGRADALFAYDFESGELLAEYELDAANDDPRGIWSDGVTIWVADHGAKRLIAYRLPVLPDAETDLGEEDADDDARELERVSDEEFTELSKASNNSPRGIWSDGDVMYVADESDDRVYSYNMPDAIDARLASLTLSGVDIGEFDPGRPEYEAVVADGVTETTVEAEAAQRRTDVAIDPPDADGDDANGHQVALQDLGEITVTVTSQDGSRKKTYRVQFPETAWDPARDAWPHCLRGAVSEGFSLVVYEGGGVAELVGCAESRGIVALYVLHEGVYVSYILGAPDFVNAGFVELFPDGLPPITPLIVGSNGPPSADPFADLEDGGQQPWPECLRGAVSEGFSLVVYEGGSVDELEACAQSRDVAALYALSDGVFVSNILGAPDFVTQPFRDLFADGLPLMTPLVARSEGQPGGR